METETTTYPIETSSLRKGDSIPLSTLCNILKAQPGSSRFAFGVMRLKEHVVKSLAMRGLFVTVIVRNNELMILTDAEANTYNMKFAKTGARRIRRSRARHAMIDLSKLTPEQRNEWDRNATRLAVMTSSLSSKKKLPEAVPHTRIE